MAEELLQRLRQVHDDYFPAGQGQLRNGLHEGQRPNILLIDCCDSRGVR